MNSVRLFDFIAYDGDSYQVIAQDGARLALKSLEDTLWLYGHVHEIVNGPLPCLLYTSPSPRDAHESRMPSSA